MTPFQKFSQLIHARFIQLSKHELFVTGKELTDEKSRELEALYLASFPEGTNPIYITNTEHDCSCCKNFIRNIGNAVAIINGKIETVWDVPGAEYPYDVVAKKMAEFVRSNPIIDLYRTDAQHYGAEKSRQLLQDGSVKTWNHFFGSIASRHFAGPRVAQQTGDFRTGVQLFKRGLTEITEAALSQVIELAETKAIYRGEEFLPAVKAFYVVHQQYAALKTDQERDVFVWSNATSPVARFNNHGPIAELVKSLSKGEDLEGAVREYESFVAPTNYKRTTALITPRMIQDAMQTINGLGLEPALQRRFAKISDVSVNNVLWVDNDVKTQMKGGLESILMKAATEKVVVDESKIEKITIEDFMKKILPTASSMEMLVNGSHQNNFMSITAPVHENTGQLFKWNNDFGWSYDGNITDSIKEKVKKAGGNVTNAKLRVSLAWFNYDDLDIHVMEPTGNIINFFNKGGKLDVDMNAGGGRSREPVENVSWTTVMDGVYKVNINQYNRRETADVGFVVEVECEGRIMQYSHPKAAVGMTHVLNLTMRNGKIEKIEPAKGIIGGGISQEKWGIKTETFVKVNTLMLSPNFWDDNKIGNKHWFFILDGCKNDTPTRGIYNEFLNSKLDKHRKVFEVVGDKTKCQPTEDQLSGLGFSSTRGDEITVKVKSQSASRMFNIVF